jgi:sensor c-di-GMP phosphodiesterase-like protein
MQLKPIKQYLLVQNFHHSKVLYQVSCWSPANTDTSFANKAITKTTSANTHTHSYICTPPHICMYARIHKLYTSTLILLHSATNWLQCSDTFTKCSVNKTNMFGWKKKDAGRFIRKQLRNYVHCSQTHTIPACFPEDMQAHTVQELYFYIEFMTCERSGWGQYTRMEGNTRKCYWRKCFPLRNKIMTNICDMP